MKDDSDMSDWLNSLIGISKLTIGVAAMEVMFKKNILENIFTFEQFFKNHF